MIDTYRVTSRGSRAVRFVVTREGEDVLTFRGFDRERRLVVAADGVRLRELTGVALAAASDTEAHGLVWSTVGRVTPREHGVVVVGDAWPGFAGDTTVLRDPDALRGAVADGMRPPDVVVVPVPVASASEADDATRDALELLGDERFGSTRIVITTRDAVVVGPGDRGDRAVVSANALALVRVAHATRGAQLRIVDADADTTAADVAGVAGGDESEIAVRRRQVVAPRVSQLALPVRRGPWLGASSSLLVTTDGDDIGRTAVLRLAQIRGVGRVVVASAGENASRLAEDLRMLGIVTTMIDALDPAALSAALSPESGVRAVIHASGPVSLAARVEEAAKGVALEAFVVLLRGGDEFGLFDDPGAGEIAGGSAVVARRLGRGLRASAIVLPETWSDAVAARLDGALAWGGAASFVGSFDESAAQARFAETESPSPLRGLLPDAAAPTIGLLGARAALAQRFADAAGDETLPIALEIVRSEAALVLDLDSSADVAPDRRFLELGLDSQNALVLVAAIGRATAIDVGPELLFDHPTAAGAAAELLRLRTGGDVGRHTVRTPQSKIVEAMERLGEHLRSLSPTVDGDASDGGWRGAFVLEDADDTGWSEAAIELASGPARPRLICLNAVLPMSGPHEYAQLARSFRGTRDVVAIPTLGFGTRAPVPATFLDALRSHAAALRATAGSEPFVLVGHSSGGLLAYALAALLERQGSPCAGLVLMDTYTAFGTAFSLVQHAMVDRLQTYDGVVALTEERLAATAAWAGFLLAMDVEPLTTPTLLLRAADPPRGVDPTTDWRSTWVGAHDLRETTGDHFSMVMEHAADAARAVESWVAELMPVGGVQR